MRCTLKRVLILPDIPRPCSLRHCYAKFPSRNGFIEPRLTEGHRRLFVGLLAKNGYTRRITLLCNRRGHKRLNNSESMYTCTLSTKYEKDNRAVPRWTQGEAVCFADKIEIVCHASEFIRLCSGYRPLIDYC